MASIYDYDIWSRVINTRKTVLSHCLIIKLREWQQTFHLLLERRNLTEPGSSLWCWICIWTYQRLNYFQTEHPCWFHPGSLFSAPLPSFSLKWHSLEFVIRIYLLQAEQWNSRRWKKNQKTSKPTAGVICWSLKWVRS